MQDPTPPAPPLPAADLSQLLDEVRRLVLDVAETDLTELEVAIGGARVQVRQAPGLLPLAGVIAVTPREAASDLHAVRSPLNGVYYARANPNAEPYVRVGDAVDADQTVCLIEAMKSFNEIHAEKAGRIARIVVESGQVVNAGDTLLLIEPSADSAPPADAT